MLLWMVKMLPQLVELLKLKAGHSKSSDMDYFLPVHMRAGDAQRQLLWKSVREIVSSSIIHICKSKFACTQLCSQLC
jgi:hypothetical protein